MRKRAKHAKIQKLGDVLQGILKKHKIFVNPEEQRLLEVWQKAVGPQIAAQTRPERIKKQTLFVKVSTSVWMQQLHFLKQEILEKCNHLLGKESITNIYFSIGDVPSPLTRKSPQPPLPLESYPLKDSEKKIIENKTSTIEDPELRELLKRLMAKDIIRRRRTTSRKAP